MLGGLVRAGNGVEVLAPGGAIALDPRREGGHAVLSHAHTDHIPGRSKRRAAVEAEAGALPALMTAPTLDLLRIRRPANAGRTVAYGEAVDMAGATVTLRDAGHVFGSAMVRVDVDGARLLYTGDFSPAGGRTCGQAKPEEVDVLVIETTYGEPRFTLPPRDLVLANLETWLLRNLLSGSVALGAHELGRAQELIGFLNRAGVVPVVPADVARIAAVYNAHGHDLAWAVLGSPRAEELRGNACYVVPQAYLKKAHPFVARLKEERGKAAFLSGWCQVYSYFENYAIDAQFPLTDHATFPELLAFVEACRPKEILAVHGRPEAFAREVMKRLGIPARALVE